MNDKTVINYSRKAARIFIKTITGKKLAPDEIVHHVDGNPRNNDPNNLVIMDKKEHTSYHLTGKLKGRPIPLRKNYSKWTIRKNIVLQTITSFGRVLIPPLPWEIKEDFGNNWYRIQRKHQRIMVYRNENILSVEDPIKY